MRIGATFSLALRRVLRRPVRSFLLLQGTVWGVAVAIFPSAVVGGTREAALTRGRALGADRIAIATDPTTTAATALERADVGEVARALGARSIEGAVAGVEILGFPGGDERTGVERPCALLAAEPEAPRTRGLALVSGRWLSREDGPLACVVEAGVGAWVGRPGLAPGDDLRLPGWPETLRVVGVTAPRAADLLRTNDLGFDVDHALFRGVMQRLLYAVGVPVVGDAWKRSDRCVWVLPRGDRVDWLFLRVSTPDVRRASEVAEDVLVARGKAVITLSAVVLSLLLREEVDRFAAVDMALFLACLVMGAVVMTNLGLLTALRRAREIAIRRVEGATRADVAFQFLAEGLLLTVVGAGVGLALGIALAELRVALEPVTGYTWAFPWNAAAVAVSVALVVGLLASTLPALRAARQQPVEGLVDE
jgi:hypothetical protein